ncbi:hypothetical protein Agabi119p4_5232 [Agaricus bisporus var. burnettii]|uniref:DUF6533 domain-containing protein n=1 Tax=Agaricus bisporus var. burnettii TaxID=192524 RepID=A0A8H7F4T8_AGABI|nr:hypothetical protein Agabi119p4_5232 [Agaricus bisporus var. burnettii]
MANQTFQLQVQTVTNIQYAELAGATLLAFDWILNFSSEVEMIWKAKWNLVKVLYLITRYLPLAIIPLDLFYISGYFFLPACVAVYDTVMALFVISLLSAQLIFTLRTVAVWGKEKRVTYILFGAFSFIVIAIPTLTGLTLKSHRFVDVEVNSGKFCLLRFEKSYGFLAATFVFVAAYDIVILIFMLTRRISVHQFSFPLRSLSTTDHAQRDSRLLKRVYDDGIIFYVYIFGVSVANIIVIFVSVAGICPYTTSLSSSLAHTTTPQKVKNQI